MKKSSITWTSPHFVTFWIFREINYPFIAKWWSSVSLSQFWSISCSLCCLSLYLLFVGLLFLFWAAEGSTCFWISCLSSRFAMYFNPSIISQLWQAFLFLLKTGIPTAWHLHHHLQLWGWRVLCYVQCYWCTQFFVCWPRRLFWSFLPRAHCYTCFLCKLTCF